MFGIDGWWIVGALTIGAILCAAVSVWCLNSALYRADDRRMTDDWIHEQLRIKADLRDWSGK